MNTSRIKTGRTGLVVRVCLLSMAALLAVGALPALAQPGGSGNAVRISAGLFEPDGESQYWDETFQTFTGSIGDFEDLEVSIEYQRRFSRFLSLVFGVGVYQGLEDQAYLDFVDTQGFDILHETSLDVASATLGLRLDLLPAGSTLVPYLSAGGGLYSWQLSETGEFIDFNVVPEEIFFTSFEDDGSTFGFYWAAGLEVALGQTWSVFAEAKFTEAEDDLSGDFGGLGELDLSGQRIAAGFSWSF